MWFPVVFLYLVHMWRIPESSFSPRPWLAITLYAAVRGRKLLTILGLKYLNPSKISLCKSFTKRKMHWELLLDLNDSHIEWWCAAMKVDSFSLLFLKSCKTVFHTTEQKHSWHNIVPLSKTLYEIYNRCVDSSNIMLEFAKVKPILTLHAFGLFDL